MSQDIGFGGTLVDAWRPLQADQAFQPLEGEFDAPAQAMEGKDVGGGEFRGGERGDQGYPIGRRQGLPADLVTAFLRRPTRRKLLVIIRFRRCMLYGLRQRGRWRWSSRLADVHA